MIRKIRTGLRGSVGTNGCPQGRTGTLDTGTPRRRTGLTFDKIYCGREGVLTGDDRERAKVSMLALHLLQSSLVFINTQLLQAVLRDPGMGRQADRKTGRGLSPLFWSHVNPYGRF